MRARNVLLAGIGIAVGAMSGGSAAASTHPAAKATVTTVVSGLDNPRGLAFGGDGRLYVAEAGHGGPNCLSGPGGATCAGLTSAISRINIAAGTSRRVVKGLISLAGSDGSAATGVDGISFVGRTLYGIENASSPAVPPSGFPAWLLKAARNQLGRLIVAGSDGHWKSIANVGLRDYVWSGRHKNLVPGQFPDANPYGVLALRDTRWVVDAGSNTLDRVNEDGHVSVVKFFPNPPSSDAVPTCLARGGDGALYIGELTGGGNVPGASVVWRYSPATGKLSSWATGLTAVTGCGFGRDGHFYATEFSSLGLDKAAPGTGRVVRVPAHSNSPITVVGSLNFPGGFAAGPDGSLYVSNWSILPAHGPAGAPTGSVVRIKLHS
jgi:hypothetical protein